MPSINSILIKRNNLSGVEPSVSDLTLGELALNSADGKLFIRTETPDLTSVSTFLNSKDLPYVLNESLSSINTQHGGNTVSQVFGAVLGGYKNDNSGAGSTVVNGENNDINGDFSTILNGLDNKIESTGDYSAILGGKSNLITHENSFTIGSNLSSHANDFTYVNNISAQGILYGDGRGLTNLAAAVSPDLAVRSLTANWESTYLTVSSLSASWASSSGEYLPLSGGTLTGTIAGDLSATGSFYGDGSKLTGIVAGDIVATTLVRSNSANWDSTYTTVQSNSADWANHTDTGVRALTSNWQSTYTSYNSNSASFVTTSFADSKYVPLSGATMTGTLAAPTLSATTFYGNGSNVTNINASNITIGTLGAARLPTFNGDITANTSNGSVSATVVAIQGSPISVQNPANGQILQWNGTAWVPGSTTTGGSGGGGVTYYFNYANYTNISPTNGLPTSPVAPSLLGREYSVGDGSLQSGELTRDVYTLVAGFVSLSSEPAVTNIPAGIWDFNMWVDIVGNSSVNQTSMQIRVYKYISSTSTYTPLASSEDLYIYDPTVIAQYIASVTIPQTTLLSSDRIYIEFWAAKSVNQSRQIRFWFDSSHPSHVHTTLPSVAGSGLVKTVNGVYQSPASLLVNVDVAANAAIDQSKINGLTEVASKTNTTYTTVQTNSATTWNYQGTDIKSLSSGWVGGNNVYTTVNSNSGTWNYSTLVQIFSSSGTWTKPDGAKSITVLCIGGGGGGGSGRVNAGTNGGGGGAGGGYTLREIPASILGATETVTVGASGAGGIGVNTANAQGNNGTAGGDSSFGTLPWVFAGGGGGGSGSAGGAAGGPNGRTIDIGGYAGGGGSAAAGGAASAGSPLGAGGGGGGGGSTTTMKLTSWYAGGNGFPSFGSRTIGGQSVGGATAGAAGTSGDTLYSYIHAGGGGAGGAGNGTGNGGAGGNGAVYGGGGGGGGCCGWYPGTSGQTYSSGAGGNGAQGIVIVTTYF